MTATGNNKTSARHIRSGQTKLATAKAIDDTM